MNQRVHVLTLTKHAAAYVKGFLFVFVLAMVLMGVDLFFSVGNVWIQQYFIDLIGQGRFTDLFALVKMSLAVGIGCLAMMIIQFMLKHISLGYLERDVSLDFFEHCNKVPLLRLQKFSSGDVIHRINKDTSAAANILHILVFDIIFNILMCTVVFIYLARMDLMLALLALLGGPITFLIPTLFNKTIRQCARDVQRKDAQLRNLLQEIVQEVKFIKTLRAEERILTAVHVERKKHHQLIMKQSTLLSGMNQAVEFSFHAIAYTCAFFVAMAAIRGVLTPGQVLSFLFLTMRLMGPFLGISQLWGDIQKALASGDRLFELGRIKREVSEAPTIQNDRSPFEAALQIKNGSFSFDGERPFIHNLNLTIRRGSSVAIIGSSGSGKSTLLKICCGLYPLAEGQLDLFGEPYDLDREGTKEKIAYVPQEPYVFVGSIRNNIELGCGYPITMDDVAEAALHANATEFINELGNQFDTVVKEKGSSLSRGQRQRIALARAWVRKAPLVILDEVTSALDYESERLVSESIFELLESGTTVIFATHHLWLAQQADRIIVMENGSIAEDGSPEELTNRNGLYAKLQTSQ